MRLVIDNSPVRYVSDWLIREPVRGAWRGQLVCDAAPEAVEGAPFVLDDVWVGSIVKARTAGLQSFIEITGGAGKLAQPTKSRQYSGGTPKLSVLRDLCADAGETAGDASGMLGQWRARGAQLATELQRLSPDWRTAPDGTIVLSHTSIEAPA